MAPQPSDPRVETVLQILDELPIHAAQHDIDDAAVRIVAAMDEAATPATGGFLPAGFAFPESGGGCIIPHRMTD